jgi:UDP-N-acetylmuramate dehydrogenase
MRIYRNIPLKKYNTFRLDYVADFMVHVRDEQEAISFFRRDIALRAPILIVGSGSNILFTSDFKGTILRPEFSGIKVEEQNQEYAIVSAGAGVNWDNLVEWTVNKGFSGLENLSLIPGLVGATPVQNIGAYGVEAQDKISKVRAISISDGRLHEFSNNECEFGYRTSIFKGESKGKYLVTSVSYKLAVEPLLNLNYGSLEEEVNRLGNVILKNVRQAVINIRRSKLPDPEIIGNAGSFFKNPVVSNSVAESIKNRFPQIPSFNDQSGRIKLAAGWLIEQCGWKGKRIGDAGVHEKQALVLVNYGKATGKEIFNLSEDIKKSVMEIFDIELEREVEVIGTI